MNIQLTHDGMHSSSVVGDLNSVGQISPRDHSLETLPTDLVELTQFDEYFLGTLDKTA